MKLGSSKSTEDMFVTAFEHLLAIAAASLYLNIGRLFSLFLSFGGPYRSLCLAPSACVVVVHWAETLSGAPLGRRISNSINWHSAPAPTEQNLGPSFFYRMANDGTHPFT